MRRGDRPSSKRSGWRQVRRSSRNDWRVRVLLLSEVGAGLGEYLCRALAHRARLAEPRDLAWLLASHARDALARVEAAGDAPSLEAVRAAHWKRHLASALRANEGARFFRSTLVQTLFYGVFSAWVLWARQTPQTYESV